MSIQYLRFEAERILVRFGGIQRNIKDSEERIDEIMSACIAYQKDPSEENEGTLRNILNPITKKEFSENFEIDEDENLYLKGTKHKLPENLALLVRNYISKGFPVESLVNFWKLCLANPNETARNGFYDFVKNYGIVITNHGYVILYKSVDVLGKNSHKTQDVNGSLSRWASSEYLRIKNMKKSPKNYPVYEVTGSEDTEYVLSTHKGEFPEHQYNMDLITYEEIGNLQELYDATIEKSKTLTESDDEVTIFRPYHSGKHGMTIRLGEPVTMPREKCDPDISRSCSYGLHVGAYDYVKDFARNMDCILAVLVNPRDIVALPSHDISKLRVCEYFPYAEIKREDDGTWQELQDEFFEDDFLDYEIEEIEKILSEIEIAEEESEEEYPEEEKEALKERLVYLRDN